jgi:hypothetical protein
MNPPLGVFTGIFIYGVGYGGQDLIAVAVVADADIVEEVGVRLDVAHRQTKNAVQVRG